MEAEPGVDTGVDIGMLEIGGEVEVEGHWEGESWGVIPSFS